MKNKYADLADKAREERRKNKMCTNKKVYETKELADVRGQETYQCQYCGLWHRTAKVNKLIKEIRKPRKFPKLKIKYRNKGSE